LRWSSTHLAFALPWSIRHNDDAYWVDDANGRRFAFTYFHDRQIAGTGGRLWGCDLSV
jgi:hypothetical protein